MMALYSSNLDLMRQSRHRWLMSSFSDSNHYMYLHFAWPGFFASKFCAWFRVRDWLYPKMAGQSRRFELLATELIDDLERTRPSEGLLEALLSARDPISKQSYPKEEVHRELKMLTRAGKVRSSLVLCSTN